MFFWGKFLQFGDKKKGWQIQQRGFLETCKKHLPYLEKKNKLLNLDNVFLYVAKTTQDSQK
jgi:hypothetical protein